jgi:hypothetical protein
MFGKWAGYAGFLDILHGLGQRLKFLGHKNPFERMVMAHDYFDSKEAVEALKECGEEVNDFVGTYLPLNCGRFHETRAWNPSWCPI